MKADLVKIVKGKWERADIISIEKLSKGYKYPIFDVKIKNPNKNIVVKLIKDNAFENRGKLEKNVISLIKDKHPDFPSPTIIRVDNSKKIILSHISENTNTYENSYITIKSSLSEKNIYPEIYVSFQGEPTEWIE